MVKSNKQPLAEGARLNRSAQLIAHDSEGRDIVKAETVLTGVRRAAIAAGHRMAALEQALPYRHRIVGVGLDSAEKGNPPGKFREVFDRARAHGFLTVAHAGEEGPASYVRDALDLLHAARIDHGIRALDDPALVARLARERVPLTVCPLSNVRLRVVDDIRHHPLRRMMEAGLLVTSTRTIPLISAAM